MKSRRLTYTASFSVGGDTPTWEGEVEFSYTVTFGAPEQGPSFASGGQPADPDEVDDIRCEKIDGNPAGWSDYESDAEVGLSMIERLTDDDLAAMIAEAYEQRAADLDARDEDRAERLRMDPDHGDDL